MAKKRRVEIDRLRHELEVKVDDLDRRLTETEEMLLERRLAAEPVTHSLLPVLDHEQAPSRKTPKSRS